MAAAWKALEESCTGPDVVARNLAQAETERQSTAMQGCEMALGCANHIQKQGQDQETVFFECLVVSPCFSFLHVVHVFERVVLMLF